MKTLFFLICIALAFSTACSVGLRPRSGPQTHIGKVAMLANAEIAFAQSPTAENHILLGQALASFGRHDTAIERYEQAVAINKGGSAAYSHLCIENNILRKWDEAIRNCETALSIEPKHDALARNGLRYAQRAKAVEEELTKDSSGQINLGMQHYSKNDWKTAIEIWGQVSENSPYFATARSNMASAYIMLKDFPNARAAINQAIQLEPGNPLFQNNVTWLERASAERH